MSRASEYRALKKTSMLFGSPNMKNFLFQAEDGIRDKLVTGVQTCALPIWNTCGCDVRRGEAEAAGQLTAPLPPRPPPDFCPTRKRRSSCDIGFSHIFSSASRP